MKTLLGFKLDLWDSASRMINQLAASSPEIENLLGKI
jgi:hypothetical protein